MNFSSFRYGVIGKRSLVVLALGLAVACGDDAETPPEQGQDGSEGGDAGSDTGDGSETDGTEGGDGSEGDGAPTDGSASDAGSEGDGEADGGEGPDLARGEFLLLRSCGTCHGASNQSLAVATGAGEVNLDTIKLKGDELIGRINSTERPMPPAFASGDQILSAEEKALVIAYIESVSN